MKGATLAEILSNAECWLATHKKTTTGRETVHSLYNDSTQRKKVHTAPFCVAIMSTARLQYLAVGGRPLAKTLVGGSSTCVLGGQRQRPSIRRPIYQAHRNSINRSTGPNQSSHSAISSFYIYTIDSQAAR